MSLSAIRTAVTNLSRVPTTIVGVGDSSQQDQAIQDAVREYSRLRPRTLVASVAAVGGSTNEYSLSTAVSGWNEDTHTVRSVVYPYNAGSGRIPSTFDTTDYEVVKVGSTMTLRFLRYNPAAGYNIGIYYEAPHTVSSGTDTITDDRPGDLDAFHKLAAACVCDQAAAFYSDKALSTIGADAVNYGDLANKYEQRATSLRKAAHEHIDRMPGPSSVRLNYDSIASDGEGRLWNQRARF